MSRCISGTVDKVVRNPQIPFHPSINNVGLDFENAFGIPIEEYMAVFIPASGLFGPCSDLGRLLRSAMTMGVIINCLKDIWIVESEPTMGDGFGMLIHTERGKTVMSGQGRVTSQEVATGGRTSSMEFSIKTVYDYVSSSPRKDRAEGGGSWGPDGPRVEVKYVFEF
jgi:hypothetical protein